MASGQQQFDAIIVGAGHNGLTAACYLAGAGLNVCVLERYHKVGGAAISEEHTPGYTFSTGSYVLSLAPRQIFDELGAWEEGIELLPRNPRFFAPFPDGSSLTMWNDHQTLARTDPPDFAQGRRRLRPLRRFYRTRLPGDGQIHSSPAAVVGRGRGRIQVAGRPGRFSEVFFGSAADIAEHFFESEQMQAITAATGIIGTFRGPRDPGTGYVKLYHSMGMSTGYRGRWAYVRGAMGSITQALARVATKRGVTIRTDAEVAQITVADGRATGVALASGEEINPGSCSPTPIRNGPISSWSDAKDVPDEYRAAIGEIKIESPVLKINLAVKELPKFKALQR